MSIQVGDNFTYKGQKPLDARLVLDTIPDMVATPSTIIYDGILVYVLSEKKFYTYNSTNTVDATLDKWRELTASGITISSATIDRVTTSPTYKHLILTLSDGTTIDCGDATGDKGDQGQGFAIIKLYNSVSDMTSDTSPVDDGQMVAVIDSSTTTITAKVYIRNSSQIANAATGDENGYTFFCNLADATFIQGPQGPKGDKGDTPVITITTVPATATMPEGKKITFTTGTGATATSVSTTIYNGINLKTASFNASNELILTLTDGSTINLGQLPGNSGSTYVTILGCFDNANIPTTCNVGDIYFNTDTNMLYECKVANTWDATGSAPTNTDIYISLADRNLYAYADSTWQSYGGGNGNNITISKKYNNAIKEITGSTTPSEDGLYVENLQPKIDRLNIAQKTVNSQLEYFSAQGSARITINKGTNVNYLPYLTTIETNLDNSRYDSTGVTLLKGKTYRLSISLLKVMTSEGVSYMLSDDAGNKFGNRGYCGNTSFSDASVDVIYTPTADIKVHPVLLKITNSSNFYPDCSFFTITEVNRSIVIDPVEYVDSTKGIEDTPVGEIIRTLGNETPKHYLACDGSTHNIADYPHLAQYFKDTFGAINVFGGNGITTFGVPDYTTEKKLNTQYMAPNAWASSIYSSNYDASKTFNGTLNTTSNYWQTVENVTFPVEIGIDLGSEYYITRYALHNLGWNTIATNGRPNTWDFEGSNDKINWNTIDTVTNYTWTDNTPEFKVSIPGSYRYYRLIIKTCVGTGVSGAILATVLNQILLYYSNSNFTHIKAEPTYFMNLEGVEVTEDLLTDKSFDITTNGVTTIDKSFTLPTPITDFDEIETVYSYEDSKVVVKDSVSGTVATATELTSTSDYKGLNFPGTSTSGITYQTIPGLTYPLTVEIAFSTTSNNAQLVFVHDARLNLVVGIFSNYIQLATDIRASKTNMAYDISSWNLNDGNFHTITVAYASANSASLYFDGVLKSSTTYSNYWTMSNVSSIGNRFNSSYGGAFKGTLYAVRFYNDILSQSDIVASYNSDKNYVLNNTAQIARNNLACEYKLYDSVEIMHSYTTSSKLSIRDIEYNSVLSVDKSVQNVTNNKAASTELQYTFTDKNNVKFLNVSNHYNNYLPGSKFGIRRLTGIRKISK